MKVVKKKYNKGGKLAKAVKKNQEEKAMTKDGKKETQVTDGDIAAGRVESKKRFGSGAVESDKNSAKENIKVANEILAELKAEYQKLFPSHDHYLPVLPIRRTLPSFPVARSL